MKKTNGSWRAQKGVTVRFANDRISGEGVVVRVIVAPLLGKGDGTGVYLVRDSITGIEHTLSGAQLRLK